MNVFASAQSKSSSRADKPSFHTLNTVPLSDRLQQQGPLASAGLMFLQHTPSPCQLNTLNSMWYVANICLQVSTTCCFNQGIPMLHRLASTWRHVQEAQSEPTSPLGVSPTRASYPYQHAFHVLRVSTHLIPQARHASCVGLIKSAQAVQWCTL